MCKMTLLKETTDRHISCDQKPPARLSSSQIRQKLSRWKKIEFTTLSVLTVSRYPSEKTKTAALPNQGHKTSTLWTKLSVIWSRTAKHSIRYAGMASPQRKILTNQKKSSQVTLYVDTGHDKTVHARHANKPKVLSLRNGRI